MTIAPRLWLSFPVQLVIAALALVALGVLTYLGVGDAAVLAWLTAAAAWLVPQPVELVKKIIGALRR